MIVKVVNQDNEDYNKEFKLRRMNYDQCVVNYPNSKGINIFLNKDLKFIPESDVDDFLINNKDFLKIKLNRGISVQFYKILFDSFKDQFEEIVEEINLLKDKYSVNKRGIWEKEIICVINDKIPVKIIASGQNFRKNNYKINIEEINREEFLEVCNFEMNKIKKEIKENQSHLLRYERAINVVKFGDNSTKLLT
ncbi:MULTISPECIES: hypothetical protein [Bacillota]|uniref:hypothetical protein n=1 Tax=Bacillota TaxID=1239 RepID=UPI0018976B36|nr:MULTISPECIES: hypothetical protein [Bacillota]MCR1952085.1 hypothetical protein [Clostridium sp. DSM 100503]MCR2013782.1 hypothetical protein [Bacillus cereus]